MCVAVVCDLLPIFSSFILVKTAGLEGIYLAGDRIHVTLTSIFYPTWQNIRPPRVTTSVLFFPIFFFELLARRRKVDINKEK